MNNQINQPKQDPVKVKQPYQEPKLEIFGTVTDLTLQTGSQRDPK